MAFAAIDLSDPALIEIVIRSLHVSVSAVVLAALIGLPLGGYVALSRFPGRGVAVVLLNALMGLPPVVVGLSLYLLLSRSGPLGVLDLLFTPTAMIIAQCVLVTPIIAALARQRIEDLWDGYGEQLRSMGANKWQSLRTLLWDDRAGLTTVVLAGFGRAIAEVGAVFIVGGNIEHHTRVMTTTITLETSKGDLDLAMGLGVVLIALAIAVNALAYVIGAASRRASAGRRAA